jgi:hypothetical protein
MPEGHGYPLVYIYIAKKEVVAKTTKVWDDDWSYFEFKVFHI